VTATSESASAFAAALGHAPGETEADEAFRGVGIDPEPARQRVQHWLLRHGIVVALVAELIFFTTQSDRFFVASNFRLVLTQTAATAVLAVPVGLLLLSGYIDFACGSIAGLAGAVMGMYMDGGGKNILLGVGIAIGVGAVAGAVQGALATKLTLAPIIVTLGFYTGVRGLVFVIDDGKLTNKFGQSFARIGRGKFLWTGLPNPIIISAAVMLIGWIFLSKSKAGRHTVSLGVNPEAARRAGISLYRLPFMLYVAAGAAAGIAALITAARLDAAPPTLGDGFEIDVLSAVLLGGVAFGGGKASVPGIAAGVLFIGFLNNGLLMMGAPPFWLRVSSGLALVAAAALDGTSRYFEKRQRGGGR
jgi:ribose/xylose/arabinose/galactoside ABC-type transport system permease subunit